MGKYKGFAWSHVFFFRTSSEQTLEKNKNKEPKVQLSFVYKVENKVLNNIYMYWPNIICSICFKNTHTKNNFVWINLLQIVFSNDKHLQRKLLMLQILNLYSYLLINIKKAYIRLRISKSWLVIGYIEPSFVIYIVFSLIPIGKPTLKS